MLFPLARYDFSWSCHNFFMILLPRRDGWGPELVSVPALIEKRELLRGWWLGIHGLGTFGLWGESLSIFSFVSSRADSCLSLGPFRGGGMYGFVVPRPS